MSPAPRRSSASRPRVRADARGHSGAPAWLLDAGLFVTAVLLVEPVVLVWSENVVQTRLAMVQALGVHTLLSIYDGRFGRWRTVTWLALFAVWTGSAFAGFLRYVLPWGQVSFWLAAKLVPIVGPEAFSSLTVLEPLWSILVLALPAALVAVPLLDIALLHVARVSLWRPLTIALVAIGIIASAVALHALGRLLLGSPPTTPGDPMVTPLSIIPSMDIVWVYAVLRCVPSKPWGVAATFAVMVLPMVWPRARAWRFHAARTRGAWTVLTLGLLVCWLGLTYLGMQPPTETAALWSRGLALYDAAFFLALPVLLGRLVPPAVDERADVFV